MTVFRPCIDLHQGQVKQIVGGSLSDDNKNLKTNFVSKKSSEWYAKLYAKDQLKGGHIIMLGPSNESAAIDALKAYPSGMQIGGGINIENAQKYLDAGASHVIVTSWIFTDNQLNWNRIRDLSNKISKQKLVLDLSCRRVDDGWNIATNRWQTITSTVISPEILNKLSKYCDEFLIHAADVEGLQAGMDEKLIVFLAKFSPIKCTYAGGAKNLDDLDLVNEISDGKVDLTIGSALDIFGGTGVDYQSCVEYNVKSMDF